MPSIRCTALLIAALLAGCGSGDKAGGPAGSLTLRIGTNDLAGRPSGRAIAAFANAVRSLSDGRMRIAAVYNASPENARDFDQLVARQVESGRLDMGIVPTRAWDTEGVSTLRALQAPYLIDSQALLERVVTGGAASEMLAGLDRAGVHGLALIPESLRHVFGFDHVFAAPEDFAGRTVRAPHSAVSYALLRELGSRPDDVVDLPALAGTGRASGDGAESDFTLATGPLRTAVATGNVTLFPKVEALVVGRDAWSRLSHGQRRILERAAGQAQRMMLGAMVPEAQAARRFCARGGRVAVASATDRAALLDSAQPVYAELERDATTRRLIGAVRDLARGAPAPEPLAPCAAPASGGGGASPALDGLWRYTVSYQEGLAAGLRPEIAARELGVQTVRMRAGVYDWGWRSRTGAQRCTGTYETVGDRVTFTDDPPCDGVWDAAFQRRGDSLHWHDARDRGSGEAQDQIVRELINGKPWQRIG